jgi:hypothetical protein
MHSKVKGWMDGRMDGLTTRLDLTRQWIDCYVDWNGFALHDLITLYLISIYLISIYLEYGNGLHLLELIKS